MLRRGNTTQSGNSVYNLNAGVFPKHRLYPPLELEAFVRSSTTRQVLESIRVTELVGFNSLV
jgi:hypothetical protein